jgi:hypothetical protein
MDLRFANPLAHEVSRAFIPPCTYGNFSPASGCSRTSTLQPQSRNPSIQLEVKYAESVPRRFSLIFKGIFPSYRTIMNADYALGRPNAYKTCRCFAMKLRVSRSARATDRRSGAPSKFEIDHRPPFRPLALLSAQRPARLAPAFDT